MNYWIIINNVQLGPMSLEEVGRQPGLTLSTPVWHDGLPDWTTAAMIPEIAALIAPQQPTGVYPEQHQQQPYQQPFQQAPYQQQPYQQAYQQPFRQQYAPGGEQPDGVPPMPNNYLIWAILATICCCIATGVVAIVYASKVSPAYYRGDYLAAQQASERASMWVIISFVLGLIIQPFLTLVQMMSM